MISGDVHKLKDLTQILADEFNSHGFNVTNKEMAKCPMSLIALFKWDIATLMPSWNKQYQVDNKKSRDLLGIQYRDFRTTIIDSGKWLIEIGAIKKKK